MANLSYLKGVRTRFLNTLKKEISNGKELLNVDLGTAEIKDLCSLVMKCKEKLSSYNEKLQEQSAKLSDAIGDTDDTLINSIITEDTSVCSEADDIFYSLKQLHHDIDIQEQMNRSVKLEEESAAQAKCMREEMRLMFNHQLRLQEEFLEKQCLKKEDRSAIVKLPTLDIPSFSGNKLRWIEFWDSFESAVNANKKLSNIDKFNYLRSKLTGEARSSIEGLTLSNENYKTAVDILQERFGNKQEVIDLHYNALIDLAPAKCTTDSLRTLYDKVERHLRSLTVMSQKVEQDVFVAMIRRKLPHEVLLQLEILNASSDKWTVEGLREKLHQYIVAREKTEKVRNTDSSYKSDRPTQFRSNSGYNQGNYSNASKFSSQTPKFSSQASKFASEPQKVVSQTLVTNTNSNTRKGSSRNHCRYCNKQHWSDECQQYRSIEERQKQLKGSCFKCLKEGHYSSDCKTSKACVYCGQMSVHHRSLCPKKFQRKRIQESAIFSEVDETKMPPSTTHEENVLLSSEETVLMQIAFTEIKKPCSDSGAKVRLLMDSGSQRSYITQRLANQLDLVEENEQEIRLVTFASEKVKVIRTRSTNLDIKLSDGNFQSITVNVVPSITGTIQRKPVVLDCKEHFAELTQNMKLADSVPKECESDTVDLLIGNDYYLDFIMPDKLQVQPGLYLLASRLGWILTGRTPTKQDICDKSEVNMLIMTHGNQISKTSVFASVDSDLPRKPDLEDFWNIESIGINKSEDQNNGDEKAMQKFKSTLRVENGRYQATWPWKEEVPDLPNNRNLAIGRLRSLTTKFRRQPDLLDKYDEIIQDQTEKGMIEKVDSAHADGIRHYIPHHMIVKPVKTGVKLRVVYDASAKTRKENKSLNDCLYRGPVLLHDLCGILMRFRLHNIGIVADIEKAFLQVGLQRQERDVTRFLWFKSAERPYVDEEHIQEFRFCRVPFGIISSPFILGATVESHLETYNTECAVKIKHDIYMDNVVTGTETADGAKDFYIQSKKIFTDAKMNLREWKTSNAAVNKHIPECDIVKEDDVNVLGHNWNAERDTLSLNKVEALEEDQPLTKRSVLKQVASVYDPLGLLSPVTLPGKILIQNLWKKNLDWDDKLDHDDSEIWISIKNCLKQTHSLEIKRCIAMSKFKGEVKYSLICFCDASTKAFATTVYLHQDSNESSKVDIVFSKSRLAPVKEMTIPRLELMAVLIGVRCVKFVEKQLKLELTRILVLTDSQCVLNWIISEKSLPVFVENRVKEIREHTDITFYYVNTKENPSDIASRGCTLQQLQKSELWWHGPEWLVTPMKSWPLISYLEETRSKTVIEHENVNECIEASENSQECKIETSVLSGAKTCAEDCVSVEGNDEGVQQNVCASPFNMDIQRYSSWLKLIRTTAWCLRFVQLLKGTLFENKSLTSSELEVAENMWITYVQNSKFTDVISNMTGKHQHNLVKQLGLYRDSAGLLRCKGRLENADLCESSRFPILLPNNDNFTKLVIEHIHHGTLHSGTSQTWSKLRYKFWVPHGRATVRKVLKSCLKCRRLEGGPYKMPPMAPLPRVRVSETVPYSHTGIDYMGPLYVKDIHETKKVWVCLFTCMVSRAVHLEMVQDMSTNTFLNCLRRFIATRGAPETIICDNAMHFKLASETIKLVWVDIVKDDEVQSYCANRGIKWSFITELAPWMGGFYERLVGLVKRSLRKAIGRKLLGIDQLHTVIKEAEAVVNSRPLVYVEDDINSHITLTPGHFTCLNPRTGIPQLDTCADTNYKPLESSADKLLKIWQKGQKLLDSFWQIWRSEYLLSLRDRYQTKLKSKRVQSSSVPCVGDVVLVRDDLPRGSWRFGKVVDLKTSGDGHVRSANVKTPTGRIIGRPLNLLYPMEVTDQCSDPNGNITSSEADVVSENRPTRYAAEKARKRIKDMLGDREAISRFAYEFCEDCANNNIRYVEARYSPHLLANSEEKPEYATEQGDTTPQEVVRLVTDAFRRGSKDFNIRAYSILCCMRHRPDWSEEIVLLARQFQQAGVVGVDIAGGSGHHDNVEFVHDTHKQAFKRAKDYGLHITTHAGEAGPAVKVQEAVDELFAERIGHGYHCVDDDVIYQAVLNKQLHLETCPISSICTGAVSDFSNHPIIRFSRDGVNFSVNSDDPLVFDSCMLDDYHSALDMGLTREQIIKTIFSAARASFTSEGEKQTILKELVDVYGDEKTQLS